MLEPCLFIHTDSPPPGSHPIKFEILKRLKVMFRARTMASDRKRQQDQTISPERRNIQELRAGGHRNICRVQRLESRFNQTRLPVFAVISTSLSVH